MKNYDFIRKHCEKSSRISTKVIDEFLLDYAAGHHGLERKMHKLFDRFKHVTCEFPEGALAMLMSQFLAHRIFKEEGLIHKFLKLPALRRFSKEELVFLKQHSRTPWRFSFSVISSEPYKDFYLMEDIFSGDEFLLYSPAVADLQFTGRPILWFNLIGFNGSCWQSYGPIGAYNSFQPDDILFFATELNPDIEDEEEVMAHVEKDPVPYMMLWSGSNYPLSFHKEDKMGYLMSEYDLSSCNTADLKKDFVTEYNNGVYRFSPHKWGDPPHLAQAFYDENLKIILFTSMTDRGFRALVKKFNTHGYQYSDEAFLQINSSIVITVQDILNRSVVLNEYENYFQVESSPEEKHSIDALNALMARVLPDINEGRMPDIEAAARETGADLETARDIVKMAMQKTGRDLGKESGKDSGLESGKDSGLESGKDPGLESGKDPGLESGKDPGKETKTEQYRRIYLLADEIRKLAPWEWMYENDLFGVKIPGTDRIYFISIMGANGEFLALSAYKGYQGLFQFLDLLDDPDSKPPGTLLTIPHLMLSFRDREALSDIHLAAIKKSGVRFRGRGNWPLLEDVEPAYTPVLPEGESLEDIQILLEQLVEVALRVKNDPDIVLRNAETYDDLLIRTLTKTSKRTLWKDVYELLDPSKARQRFQLNYKKDTLENVSKLPEARAILQLDLVLLPNPVMEKGKRGFYPFALLMADEELGVVPGMQMLTPEPDLHSMYESVPQKVLEELQKLGYRPEKINVRSELLYLLVEEAMKETKVQLWLVEEMPQMDDIVNSLFSNLGRDFH